ncbi:MAG: hypothetical protein KGL94_14150 [Acidobacteriota bacterium]|nr:hypothetical protein [Acidobacteriota bacterium]
MSSLRPARRTTSPDGRHWEIYAYRERITPAAEARFRRLRGLFPRRSGAWLIEAVSWAPYEQRLRWSIPRERKGQVLAQVEGQLARGEQPMPRGAKQLLY